MRFHFYKQLNAMDCGATCLRMIARHHGKHLNIESLRQLTGLNKAGVSLLSISETAEKIGFHTKGMRINYDQLSEINLPCIIHWKRNHFVILISLLGKNGKRGAVVADPSQGIIFHPREDFIKYWQNPVVGSYDNSGVVLELEPTRLFHAQPDAKERKLDWSSVTRYLLSTKWHLLQVFFSFLIASILQLIFPFLTQSIVDVGINAHDMSYLTVVLVAQLMLIMSRSVVDFIRTRLLLKVSNILNLSLLSDFWIKLTRLPISYFESYHTGDTLQRVGDHKQIQSFLTGSALSTFFSLFNFVIFAIVLMLYNIQLFLVFSIGSCLYFLWIRVFLPVRRKLNYQSFTIMAQENNSTLQLVQGMQEIRLNNAEQLKRWEWENIQAGIFKLGFKNLSITQWQQAGALLINQSKDVVITFLVAQLVINGHLTIGAMLAIQYIIGQLNAPVEQLVAFTQAIQDAHISMERLNDVHQLEDEEITGRTYISDLPDENDIKIRHLSFNYPGNNNKSVLKNINLHIPQGKITAIVGVSGSGKTTLLKMLLKFYDTFEGEIKVGETDFKYLRPSFWRRQCGAVLQDGYIFNDTVARNIVVGEETIDYPKLIRCCKVANILSFIESMANGFNTRIGTDGIGISQGQKQRILIARAVYKDPPYLFFDEATNSLDANNEKTIVNNLHEFFHGRTVVIVAHRLSTVKNADKIVVIHDGEIIEEGTHDQLSSIKGQYYKLVENQLQLGN